MRKLGDDYLGVLRAVVFCTEDLQLIGQGAGRLRRRYRSICCWPTPIPFTFPCSSATPAPCGSRNATPAPGARSSTKPPLEGFTHGVDRGAAPKSCNFRRDHWCRPWPPSPVKPTPPVARSAEPLELEYQPSVKRDFAVELARNRAREKTFRATLVGPHRDELQLRLDGQSAAKFASEGQKRSIAIALKLAQAEHLTTLHGAPPILLIDDVMGELDAKRRTAFLPLLERVQHVPQPGFHDLHRRKTGPAKLSRNPPPLAGSHSGQLKRSW